jgi:hypothetical protein
LNGPPSVIAKVDMGSGRVVAMEARTSDPDQPVGIRELLDFDGVVQSIEAVGDRVSAALRRVRPDRASVEFGVDISMEAGALTGLIVKGAGGAALKVTLEWERDPSE